MFNYECYKQKGTVLGTCIDGFLFGACCRLPSALGTLENIETEEDGGSEEEEEGDIVNSLVMSSSESPSLERFDLDSPPTFLSDLLKEQTSPSPVIPTSPASQTAASETSSVFIESLQPLPQVPPSIILGNGSVVSLQSLSVRPDLVEPLNVVDEAASTKAPERNQLFTWYAIDQLMGGSSTTTSSSVTSSESAKNASTSTPAPELPFLEDIAPMSNIVTTKKAEDLPSSTTRSTPRTSRSGPARRARQPAWRRSPR